MPRVLPSKITTGRRLDNRVSWPGLANILVRGAPFFRIGVSCKGKNILEEYQ